MQTVWFMVWRWGKKLVRYQTLRFKESDQHCSDIWPDLPRFLRPFLNREYHSNILDRLNAVSPNTCCSISYVSVAVLPSFWQNLMQTRCSFNTSISQYDEGQTRLHCRSTHSRLSQASTRSSGMWRQGMLPSILNGCHFYTISSFFIKKFCPGYFWSDLVLSQIENTHP
jgi:hypothetical protein